MVLMLYFILAYPYPRGTKTGEQIVGLEGLDMWTGLILFVLPDILKR